MEQPKLLKLPDRMHASKTGLVERIEQIHMKVWLVASGH